MRTKIKIKSLASGLSFLMLLLLPLGITSAQADGFTDTFDAPSLSGWGHSDGVAVAEGVLRIEPGNYAGRDGDWGDFTLTVQARFEGSGALVMSFRAAPEGGYHLLADGQRLVLQRESQGQVHEVAAVEASLNPGRWHEFHIETHAGEIIITIQGLGTLAFEESQPLLSGGIGFETLGELTAEIDQVSLDPREENPPQSGVTTTEVVTVVPGAPAYQSLPWVYTGGPIGGLGYDIRMDPRNPDVMYVSDAWAGAFKSTDGGVNWFPINKGINARVGPSNDGVPIFSLTVDPNNPDTIWVGTQFGSGVFRSDDGGVSWRSMSNGILESGLTIRGFTVEPGNSDVVYLGGEVSSWDWNGEMLSGVGFDMTRGVVYKTTDGGQNWTRIWSGDNLARYILIHPEDHNLLYVSTGIFDREAANSNPDTKDPGGVGIVRSRDGGATWQELGVENGIRPNELYFGSLSMNSENPNILIGAAGNDAYLWVLGPPLGAVYLTEDGGDSWQRVLDIPNASAVEICESNPEVVYAASLSAFYRSDDGGHTWQHLGGTGDLGQVGSSLWGSPDEIAGFTIDMQCDPRDPMRIFVNNYGGGNFLSEDGGQSWENASKGYTGATMRLVELAADNPALVFASARSGIFTSSDGGDTWRGMSHGVARAMEAWAIAVDPLDSSHLIVTVSDAGPIPKITYDGGQTWHEAEPSMWEWGVIKKVFFSTQLPGRVLGIEGEFECEPKEVCDPGNGVVFSDDGGETWNLSSLSEGMPSDLAFSSDGTIYISIFPSDIYRSIDNGQTWALVAQNIIPEGDPSRRDPEMPDPWLVSVAVDPVNANKLYAGLNRGGLLISEDGGANWSNSSAGMNPETTVLDILADPANPDVVYAAAPDSGVYLSTDGGATWRAINEGLLTRAAVDLALSEDGSMLYVATVGGGVFRLGTPTP